jgi:hypothetical protein
MNRWHFPIMRVPQRGDHSCGIAAVATVCGITFARARAELFPRRTEHFDDKTSHVSQDRMVKTIRKLGFCVRVTDDFRKFKRPAIVTFSWYPSFNSLRDSSIHSVVWDPWERRFIDPGPDMLYGKKNSEYVKLWKLSNYKALVVTQKRKKR